MVKYSVDDGITWYEIENSVRVSYEPSSGEEDTIDLIMTNEGLIVDVYDKEGVFTGKTACYYEDGLAALV